jgi:hypothetical protein
MNGTILKWDGSTWTTTLSDPMQYFTRVWGSDANNVWAISENGTILKWDGAAWLAQASSLPGFLSGIWGSSATDVWAVGSGVLLKWNGSAWHFERGGIPDNPNAIWGSDADNIWVVGYRGAIMQWNGSRWYGQVSGVATPLAAVWGSDPNNVWAVGDQGVILKWDGTAWHPQSSGVTENLTAIGGVDADTVWAVGNHGTILRWDGATWQPQNSGTTYDFHDLWAADANHVWVVGGNGTILGLVPQTHQLLVATSTAGGGMIVSSPPGIACGKGCSASFVDGAVVTLTATADAGFGFAGWAGDCTGTALCQITMSTARMVTATFTSATQPGIGVGGWAAIDRAIEFSATLGLNSFDQCTWDFGDSATASCQPVSVAVTPAAVDNLVVNTTHTFTQSGQYTVTVTAQNAAGVVQASLAVNVLIPTYVPMIRR